MATAYRAWRHVAPGIQHFSWSHILLRPYQLPSQEHSAYGWNIPLQSWLRCCQQSPASSRPQDTMAKRRMPQPQQAKELRLPREAKRNQRAASRRHRQSPPLRCVSGRRMPRRCCRKPRSVNTQRTQAAARAPATQVLAPSRHVRMHVSDPQGTLDVGSPGVCLPALRHLITQGRAM